MREAPAGHPIESRGAGAGPHRAAALDMGSNAIRYAIADVDGPFPVIIESGRFAIRLGHDAFLTGGLSTQTSAAVLRAMMSFRARLDALGVDRYRAIATSAIRDSRNGAALVVAIRREAGIDLEVISGDEEARLVWVGVRAKLGLDRPALLADLGGGSLEISLVDAERIRWTDSYPLGTVRLLEELGARAEDPSEVRKRVDALVRPPVSEENDGARRDLVITGGNADAIGDLVDPGTEPDRTTVLTRQSLADALRLLAGMPVRERVTRLGLREDRADVIVTAAIVFQRVAELVGADRLVVPRVGVQHGLLAGIALEEESAV